MSVSSVEHVLVVPTTLLHELGYFQGFSPRVEDYLDRLLAPENVAYLPRPQMEEDPSYKQLIPYVILRHVAPDSGDVSLFQYTRGSGQGEQRLHRKRSIGIGGHISADDQHAAEGSPYEEGLRRELAEEIHLATDYDAQCVGLINDDQTEVGRVHLGVVHLYDVAHPAVEPREEDLAHAGFAPLEQLLRDRAQFESWSQICLDALFA